MLTHSPWLCRIAIGVSLISAAFFVLTLADPMWIERWFDESPDGGDGGAERWIVSGGFLIAAAVAALLARRERRLQLAVQR